MIQYFTNFRNIKATNPFDIELALSRHNYMMILHDLTFIDDAEMDIRRQRKNAGMKFYH